MENNQNNLKHYTWSGYKITVEGKFEKISICFDFDCSPNPRSSAFCCFLIFSRGIWRESTLTYAVGNRQCSPFMLVSTSQNIETRKKICFPYCSALDSYTNGFPLAYHFKRGWLMGFSYWIVHSWHYLFFVNSKQVLLRGYARHTVDCSPAGCMESSDLTCVYCAHLAKPLCSCTFEMLQREIGRLEIAVPVLVVAVFFIFGQLSSSWFLFFFL